MPLFSHPTILILTLCLGQRLVLLMWLILDELVEEPLPDILLTAVVHVIRCPPSEFLYLVFQVLHEFAVSVHIGNIIPVLMMVLDATARVRKHVRHERHAATVFEGVHSPPFLFIPKLRAHRLNQLRCHRLLE